METMETNLRRELSVQARVISSGVGLVVIKTVKYHSTSMLAFFRAKGNLPASSHYWQAG